MKKVLITKRELEKIIETAFKKGERWGQVNCLYGYITSENNTEEIIKNFKKETLNKIFKKVEKKKKYEDIGGYIGEALNS